MNETLLQVGIGLLIVLAAVWLALIAILIINRHRFGGVLAAIRLVPDCLRLLKRLLADRQTPGNLRLRVWLLIAYLISPIDVVPDFLPMIGYADDIILTIMTLRSLLQRVGVNAIERRWPGTSEGLATLMRFVQQQRRP